MGSAAIHRHVKKGCIPKLYEQVCVWGQECFDDNTNHRGAMMVFLIMNLIDILEELRMLIILSRGFMKM